jgi:DNA-binding transcriptional LysR family regulator
MQLRQIRYVLELYKCGSFSKAAQNLYVTQPTLSQQIQSLEKELNLKLFVRNSRGITLTDAGDEFVSYAQNIIV